MTTVIRALLYGELISLVEHLLKSGIGAEVTLTNVMLIFQQLATVTANLQVGINPRWQQIVLAGLAESLVVETEFRIIESLLLFLSLNFPLFCFLNSNAAHLLF